MSKVDFEGLLAWIDETVYGTGHDGVVLGLSGGIDSSTTASILTRALRREDVTGLIMPIDSNPEDAKYGKWIADELNIHRKETDLTGVWHSFLGMVGAQDKDSVGSANTKARLRMCALYQYANDNNYLVAGTANKSEAMLGYATKHGDEACDFAPIAHLYKTQVYNLAKNRLDEIPDEIIEKPPSAGLWKGQTDEDELGMDYETIDSILMDIEANVGLENFHKVEPVNENEEKVLKYMEESQHKRNPVLTYT